LEFLHAYYFNVSWTCYWWCGNCR